MKHRRALLAFLLSAIAGCGALGIIGDIADSNQTAVSLANQTAATLNVTLYYSDQQEIPELLLTTVGEKEEYTIAAGGSDGFATDCEDLQAIIIEDADLDLVGEFDTSTDVLRDGDHFGCGDTLVFTFTQGLLDLDVDFDAR